MSDQPEPTPPRTDPAEPPDVERNGWDKTLAPNLIGAYLWIAFFDQIPAGTVGRVSLSWPILGSAAGGVLGYLLLFRAPALWCQQTGRPLAAVASSTFGVRGAAVFPGLLNALVQVVWIAVAVSYATSLTLRGLDLEGLLHAGYGRRLAVGGTTLPGGLFMVTALAWGLAATMAGRFIVRVIAALMSVYPVLLALLLGVTAAAAMRFLGDYEVMARGPAARTGGPWAGLDAALVALQMVFAFSASAALAAADWGAAARSPRDVRVGGWVGLAASATIVPTLAVMAVAGAQTRSGLDPATAFPPGSLTFVRAVEVLIGGRTAGAMLLGFGLAALAPACFSAYLLGRGVNDLAPGVSRTRVTVLGTLAAWALVISGRVDRLEVVFGVVGALLAPVLGALAADFTRSGGRWPGARRGWNAPGVLAWAAGTLVGFAPVLAAGGTLARVRPAAVWSFVAAYAAYLLAAALIGESKPPADSEASDRPGVDRT